MSTYDQNLHIAVDEILSITEARQKQTKSAQTSAQYGLYFAQGALITAQEKLDKVTKKYDKANLIDIQGVENSNVSTNLSATTTAVGTNVAATVTNAATAADDVQVAATAISKLAADVGAAFNLASAANFESDVYKLAEQANTLMQTTSRNAEFASLNAMEASAATAEIFAPMMVQEAATMQGEIENVLKATTAEFAKLETQRSLDNQRAAAASVQERAAEGLLTDAKTEFDAVKATLKSSNKLLNYNLSATIKPPIHPDKISIHFSFDQYQYPFPQTVKNSDTSKLIPPKTPIEYYAVFVKAAKKAQFTLNRAEADFDQHSNQNPARFYRVYSTEKKPYNILPATSSAQGSNEPADMDIFDSDGELIKIGFPYVAFLYLELPMEYKRRINDFSDLLSAPTEEFTPSYKLPVPTKITVVPEPEIKTVKSSKNKITPLCFTIPEAKAIKGAVYECIFIPTYTPVSGGLMTAGKAEKISFYFNKSIAEQISGANSTRAMLKKSSKTDYIIEIPVDATDNFGHKILRGQEYFAVVLATMESGPVENASYQTAMSHLTANPICLIPKK